MRSDLTVGLVQWLPQPGQGEENTSYACEQITRLGGSDLIVLPELWPNACSGETAALDARVTAEPLDGPRTARLARAAQASGSWVVAGSVPERVGDQIYNTALVFSRTGELIATHRKANLYTPLGEDLIYTAGESYLVVETDDIGTIGVVTCFDGDFPETSRALAAAGVHLVAHPCAFEFAARTWWDLLYPAAALANGMWWVSVNQCGTNGGVTQLGASRIISPSGTIVHELVRAADGQTPEPVSIALSIDFGAELTDWAEHCAILRQPGNFGVQVVSARGPSEH